MGIWKRARRFDLLAAGVFLIVAGSGALQVRTLVDATALWDGALESQRMAAAQPTLVVLGGVLGVSAVLLVVHGKPRAAVCLVPVATVPLVLTVLQAGGMVVLGVSLTALAFALGGALGAVFSPGRSRSVFPRFLTLHRREE